jgi:hypothetical protein
VDSLQGFYSLVTEGLLGSTSNGKKVNGKIFARVTSDVWMLIRSIKYSLIKKLITYMRTK